MKWLKSSAVRSVGLIGLLFIGLIFIRVLWGASQEYQQANVAIERGAWREGVFGLGQTIRWYAPFNPYVGSAVQQLRRLQQAKVKSAAWEEALLAAEILHSSLAAIRSFYQPYRDDYQWSVTQVVEASMVVRQNPAAMSSESLTKLYATNRDPKGFWSFLVIGAFFSWISCTLGFVFVGFNAEGVFRGNRLSWLLGAGLLGSLFLWALGLWMA